MIEKHGAECKLHGPPMLVVKTNFGLVLYNNSANFYRFVIGQLTLKTSITTAADDIHKYFFTVFQRK